MVHFQSYNWHIMLSSMSHRQPDNRHDIKPSQKNSGLHFLFWIQYDSVGEDVLYFQGDVLDKTLVGGLLILYCRCVLYLYGLSQLEGQKGEIKRTLPTKETQFTVAMVRKGTFGPRHCLQLPQPLIQRSSGEAAVHKIVSCCHWFFIWERLNGS